MAYNKILLKRRNTTGGTPTISYGELAWNQTDETLYIGTDASGGGSKVLAGEGSFVALNPAGADQTLAQSLTIGASSSTLSHSLTFADSSPDKSKIYQSSGDLIIAVSDGSPATFTEVFKVADGTGLVWAKNGFETGSIQITDDADGGKLVATGTNGGVKLVTTGTGVVTIDADSTGAGVVIDAGSAGLDVNSDGTVDIASSGAAKAVNITSNNDVVTITGKKSGASAVKLHASTVDATTTLEISSAGTGVSAVDINSAGGVDIDAAGDVAIDGAKVIVTGTSNVAQAVSLNASGGSNSTIKINSAGTAANAIDIDATGGIDINAGTDVLLGATAKISLDAASSSADAISIAATGSNGGIALDAKAGNVTTTVVGGKAITTSNHNSATAVQLNATGSNGGIAFESKLGGLNLNSAAGTIALTSTLGKVALTSTKAVAEAIKIAATGAGAATQVEITSVGTNDTSSIGASPILLSATGGGIALDAAKDITLDAVTNVLVKSASNAANAVYIHADGGINETIKVHADQGTGAGSIELTSDAGGVDINAGTSVSIDAVGAANLTSSGADVTVAATAKSVVITAGEADAGAVQITASNAAGGVDINAGTGGITVDTTGSLSLDAATNSNFTTSSGNISVDGKTGINLKANGTNAVEIAADGDVAFKANGGSTSDPDLSVAGYARFTDALEVDNIKIDGRAITSIDTDGNIDITPNGTGEVNISKVDIDSGTIDGVTIKGGSTTSLVISKGNTDVALSGTVAVTSGSATVNGTGTAFSSEIAAGDAIKIDSVVYDVDSVTSNAVLVLSANATTSASGETAYKDSALFKVQTGFGSDKLVIDKSGNVDIKTGTLTVAGNLTVNGTTTTVNSTTVQIDDNVFILGEDGAPAAATTADFGVSWARAVVDGAGFARKYGGLVWDETTDQVIISDDLGSAAPGATAAIASYANFRANHIRIGDDTTNRDVQWQKVYDKIWKSAIGETAGVPDSTDSTMQDKVLMVKRNGSAGSYTYDFELTDTLDGGTW